MLNVKENRLSICLFITAMCACVFSVALGLVVLVGWYIHNETMIQVIPAFVPMQYNTALGFVLCGSGMSLAIFKKQYSAVIVGSLAIVIGGLTLLEYSMGLNLGIDELFMKHTIVVETSHPGRMAPNTATCFVLIGSVLVFCVFIRKQIYKYQLEAIFASLAFGLGIVALSGYMIQLETAYGWGSLTRMAVHTSIGFVVLGVGALALAWREEIINKKTVLPRWLAVPTAIGTITVTICFSQAFQSEYALIAGQGDASVILVGLYRLSYAILVLGVFLAIALALLVYFAQISIRRTRETMKVNQILKDEITERKKIEEALQYEREYTEHIVSTAPNLICGIAPDGTTVFINEAVVKITGYTREEIVGKNWWKVLYSGEEYKQVEHLLHDPANLETDDYEMTLTTKNKEKRIILWNSANRYDKHRKLLQIMGIGTDITERKKSEMQISRQSTILNAINKIFKEALTCETEEEVAQTSLALAQELTDSKFGFYGEINKDGLFDTIALNDPGWDACRIPKTNAVVLLKNMKIYGIYGLILKGEKSQILNNPASHPDRIGIPEGHPPLNSFLGVPLKRAGKTIGMIALANKESGYNLDDQNAIEALSVAFVEVLASKRAEIMLRKAYDELEDKVAERTVEIKEKAEKLEKSEKALIYLLEDVNEIRGNLEKANVKLKELDQLKSMFIASMSHELRTPLNSIIGFTGIILMGIDGEINPQQKDHLGRSNKSAKHLLALINDIIDLSKVEAGKVDVFPEDIVLDEVINEAVDSVRLQANEKGLALDISVPQGVSMNTDRKRLYQCILNYMSNAVKFTETGTIRVTARETNGEVEIVVSDTGIGISKEDQQRLFKPFVRIDSHLRAKVLGTGLGLYLTRKLATELLGGTAEVQSLPGKGSTFTLRLPKELKRG